MQRIAVGVQARRQVTFEVEERVRRLKGQLQVRLGDIGAAVVWTKCYLEALDARRIIGEAFRIIPAIRQRIENAAITSVGVAVPSLRVDFKRRERALAIATLIEGADGELAHANQALVDERRPVKIYRLRLAWGRRVEIGFRVG